MANSEESTKKMPKSLLNSYLLLLVLIVYVKCANVLINVKDLPNDAVVEISGDNPITIVIPNRSYTTPFSLKLDGGKKFVSSSVGCKIYSFDVSLDKPYYRGNSSIRTDIQNFFVGDRVRFRYPDNQCISPDTAFSLYPNADAVQSVCGCSKFFAIMHTGFGLVDNSTIPDEYYPLTITIKPKFQKYSTQQEYFCTASPFSCSRQHCECISGGVNLDESSFFFPPISNSINRYGSTRSVSLAITISQNIYLIVLLIFFILYLQ